MAHVRCMLDTKGQIHILRICNTYYCSTGKVVARTRLSVTFMRTLPVLFSGHLWPQYITELKRILRCRSPLLLHVWGGCCLLHHPAVWPSVSWIFYSCFLCHMHHLWVKLNVLVAEASCSWNFCVTKSLIDLRRTYTVPHVGDCTVALLDVCECCFVLTVLETCTETPEVYRHYTRGRWSAFVAINVPFQQVAAKYVPGFTNVNV